MSDLENATQILEKAKEIAPEDGMIHNLQTQIKQAIQVRNQKEKKMYQKMFG